MSPLQSESIMVLRASHGEIFLTISRPYPDPEGSFIYFLVFAVLSFRKHSLWGLQSPPILNLEVTSSPQLMSSISLLGLCTSAVSAILDKRRGFPSELIFMIMSSYIVTLTLIASKQAVKLSNFQVLPPVVLFPRNEEEDR